MPHRKSNAFETAKKRRKGFFAKGVSEKIWTDEESSSKTNTRQRLKAALRRDIAAVDWSDVTTGRIYECFVEHGKEPT